MGFDVAIPLTESAAYDLIVDDGENLARVQCKFITGDQVDLRRIHSNSGGYVVKTSSPGAYDWLYVLKADGREYLLKECLAQRRAVNPQPKHALGLAATGLAVPADSLVGGLA